MRDYMIGKYTFGIIKITTDLTCNTTYIILTKNYAKKRTTCHCILGRQIRCQISSSAPPGKKNLVEITIELVSIYFES